MATPTTPAPTARPLAGFGHVLRSEFCKLRSVRSTWWTLIAAVIANIVLAALAAIFIPDRLSPQDLAEIDAIRLSLAGLHLSQIAFGVLGALVITSEYTTGMIRATFSAVPHRHRVLAAKAIVFGATAIVIGTASSFAAFYTFQAFLSGTSLRTSMGDPGVLRAVSGGGLYLAVLGLLGLGLGTIIRASAGTIATLFGLLFVPSILVDLLPKVWQTTVGPYLPMEAGSQIFIAVNTDPNGLGPSVGFGVFALYAALALSMGFFLLNHRDA